MAVATGLHVLDIFATLWGLGGFSALFISAGVAVSGQGMANLRLRIDPDVNLIAVAASVTIPFLIAAFGVKSAYSLNATATKLAIAFLPIATAAIVLYNTRTG